MAEMEKQLEIAIANQIEKLNNRLCRYLLQNQKRLDAMGVERLVEETKAYLQEWFPFDR